MSALQRDWHAAIIVHQFCDNRHQDTTSIDELALLVGSAGAEVKYTLTTTRRTPVSATYLGKGQVKTLGELVETHGAGLVVVDHSLTPVQERNLERALQTRVLDRTGLILDIFAQRAASHEGKLQVELAQLKHLSTRLVRGWTHLERQKGGIGLRGPGETQLETDRRLITKRIRKLQTRLEKVRAHRKLQRKSRRRIPIPVISLVGYTNAGKSTLFNRLTQENVYAADQLFATLDPVMRKLELPQTGPVILSDTVGFISNLPHSLVSAFHSTLEEVASAALLIHVVDVNDVRQQLLIDHVNGVLEEIHAHQVPQIVVYNKIDLADFKAKIIHANLNSPTRVWMSATSGEGEALLLEAIASHFKEKQIQLTVKIPPNLAKLRATCYQNDWVQYEIIDGDGNSALMLSLQKADFNRLKRQHDFRNCEIIHP